MSPSQKVALVTGASGLLGREVVVAFERKGWKAVGTALSRVNPPSTVKMDLRDHDEVSRVLDEIKPDAIVHSAADRSPDRIAADPSSGIATNVDGTRNLVRQAAKRGIFTLYISTDYVFPGTLPRPDQDPDARYRTTDPVRPINGYGLSKLKGEEAARAESSVLPLTNGAPSAAALRIPVLYGHVDPDDVSRDSINILARQIIDAAKGVKHGDVPAEIKADDVAVRFPTWTGDVGRVCADVCDTYVNATSSTASTLPTTLQFSAQESMTRYDMALKLCRIYGFDQDAFSTAGAGGAGTETTTSDLPVRIVRDSSFSASTADDHEGRSEESVMTSKARPLNCRLDVSELDRIGISTLAAKFEDWWRRELKAFRR